MIVYDRNILVYLVTPNEIDDVKYDQHHIIMNQTPFINTR